jgi:hypothetical protein
VIENFGCCKSSELTHFDEKKLCSRTSSQFDSAAKDTSTDFIPCYMPNSPRKSPDTEEQTKSATLVPAPARPAQHGRLFKIPSESIIHICCYLDPYNLYALSRTCQTLHSLIANDNTWRRAFAFQLLGIRPEESLEGANAVLLRRSARTWKKELIQHDLMKRYIAPHPLCSYQRHIVSHYYT